MMDLAIAFRIPVRLPTGTTTHTFCISSDDVAVMPGEIARFEINLMKDVLLQGGFVDVNRTESDQGWVPNAS